MICTPGETVEYFYRQSTSQGSNDWKIGDEITKNRNRPMRSVYRYNWNVINLVAQ